tara:strand:- start:1419 stop:1682 length:264 start_codon:yes stop_codon:yes gene_type:complete
MNKKTPLTTEEKRVLHEIKKKYNNDGFSVLLDDYKVSKVKVKRSHKKTISDKIIDMFIDGECPDTISRELEVKRSEVDKILMEYGAI